MFEVKALKNNPGLKMMVTCFAAVGSTNEKGGKCGSPAQTTSYPNGGQSFPTLLTIDAQFPRTSQRYLPATMSSVQLSLSFMDLRFTATDCHKLALFSECPVPTKILFKQAVLCLQC